MSDRADGGTGDEAGSEKLVSDTADSDSGDPLREIGVGIATAVAGFLAYALWFTALTSVAVVALGAVSEIQQSMLNPPALALGMFTGAGLYVQHSRDDVSFFDVRVPDRRELLYAAGGLAGLLALNFGVEQLLRYFSVPTPEHGTVELISTADPVVIAYFAVASILLIGPAEELLFRNVIQKRLERRFTPASAIALASLIFAGVHFSAYFTRDPVQFVVSLATVLLLALVLGWIYYRTRNVVVAALAHGCYNAVLFASLYAERVASLGLA